MSEYTILVGMLNEIKHDITTTKDVVNESKIKIIETSTKVENMQNQINRLDNVIDEWNKTGCPKGNLNSMSINVLSEKVKEEMSQIEKNKEYLEEQLEEKISKKEVIIWGTSLGAIVGGSIAGLVQSMLHYFKGN